MHPAAHPNLQSPAPVPLHPELVPWRRQDQGLSDFRYGEQARLSPQLLGLLAGVGVPIQRHLVLRQYQWTGSGTLPSCPQSG